MSAIFSVIGYSGSGKTTVMKHLIRHFRNRGLSVGAIKHTHHPLNPAHRGDTAAFVEAGATEVMLAGHGEALIWRGEDAPAKFFYQQAEELPGKLDGDAILIEGFKSTPLGQSIAVERDGVEKLPPEVPVLTTIRDAGSARALAELTAFLDRIIS